MADKIFNNTIIENILKQKIEEIFEDHKKLNRLHRFSDTEESRRHFRYQLKTTEFELARTREVLRYFQEINKDN